MELTVLSDLLARLRGRESGRKGEKGRRCTGGERRDMKGEGR